MAYLVLTGTTGFHLLEQHMLTLAQQLPNLHFIIQTCNSLLVPHNVSHKVSIDLDAIDTSAVDAVIGHCGAGTVFWTLERRLPLIAVVDMTRPDGHQEDLGNWVKKNKFGLVLTNRGPSIEELKQANKSLFTFYKPDKFLVEKLDCIFSENSK